MDPKDVNESAFMRGSNQTGLKSSELITLVGGRACFLFDSVRLICGGSKKSHLNQYLSLYLKEADGFVVKSHDIL